MFKDYKNIFLNKISFLVFFSILNLLLFKSVHGVFVCTLNGEDLKIISNNYLALFNWLFGFGFLPALILLMWSLFKKNYKLYHLTFAWTLLFDILTQQFFAISGAFGYLFVRYNSIYLKLVISLLFIFINYLIFYFAQKPKINVVQKPKKEIQVIPIIEKNFLPSINLLNIGKKEVINIDISKQKAKLIQVLEDFGMQIQIVDVMCGPVVTLYAVEIEAGMKASKIINLADDIARSMEVFSIRIATIPGKNLLGIEVANEKRQVVYFKEGMQSQEYYKNEAHLPLYLGVNIYGKHEIYDLAKMPHLLVAGTTGSGKSVGIHTMLLSILFKRTHEEVRFILIDPKKLELTPYEEIPHLLLPVVTEAKEAISALKWAVQEMEERYRRMSKLNVRNIIGFNAKLKDEKIKDIQKMFYIVVVIDEMADLMLSAGKEFEIYVQRLAQMGRASGIHIIMATQRPSVDVITGTIKANFPTRISFKLSTKTDSRTILGDSSGAEQLLGAGDMLYLGMDGKLIRVHGSFVTEEDVTDVVEFCKSVSQPEYITLPQEELLEMFEQENSGSEAYYEEAIELIRREKKVSTSFLQRHFPIGYNRAAKIIERMEREGIISRGDKFGRNREIL